MRVAFSQTHQTSKKQAKIKRTDLRRSLFAYSDKKVIHKTRATKVYCFLVRLARLSCACKKRKNASCACSLCVLGSFTLSSVSTGVAVCAVVSSFIGAVAFGVWGNKACKNCKIPKGSTEKCTSKNKFTQIFKNFHAKKQEKNCFN